MRVTQLHFFKDLIEDRRVREQTPCNGGKRKIRQTFLSLLVIGLSKFQVQIVEPQGKIGPANLSTFPKANAINSNNLRATRVSTEFFSRECM